MPLGSSSLPLGASISINTDNFAKFLCVQKNLADATVKNHIRYLNVFLKAVGNPIDTITTSEVQDFMLAIKETKAPETYKNYLAMLKILFRDYLGREDIIKGFKFPQMQFKPKILPSREQLRTYFDALPSLKYKTIFLMLASSGLRVSELLNAEIDRESRMLIPRAHDGSTKTAWISFYNYEAEELLIEYQGELYGISRNTVAHVFKETADKTGIEISAQTLRSVFAREMGLRGVQDRYVDAFCGRMPGSVLAMHYSDFSPEVLKQIYDKADIKFLEAW